MKRRSFVTLSASALGTAATPWSAGTAAAAASSGPPTGATTPVALESPGVLAGNLPAFFEALKDELTFPLAWGNSPIRDFRAWQRTARRTFDELLLTPDDHAPFELEVLGEEPADGYLQRTVAFNVTRHSRVRAAMLLPEGRGPFPAVLLLHDHGAKFDIGKEKLIRPWYDDTRLPSAQAWADKYFSGLFVGNQLAQRGYAVLAVDALGWGDRSGLAYEGQQALASNFFNLGGSLAGLLAREDARAAALLAGLPAVDPRRVGVLGFSMGGYRAWQLAALSDHIRATASICWMTTLKDMMVPGNNTLRGQSAFHMLHPGLYRHLDIPDVASIAAPRPMLLFDGADDPLFTAAGVDGAYERIRSVYRSRGVDDRLTTKRWPGLGHVFVEEMQAETYAWLDRWLR